MSKVYTFCSDAYDEALIESKLEKAFDELGVWTELTADKRVLIKPNLVLARKPELAVTTHPAVVCAIAKCLKKHGVNDITVADSAGGLYTAQALKSIYTAAGYRELEGVLMLNYDTGFAEKTAKGELCKSFNLINPVLKADYIINAPKLKTHTMTMLSNGVKNLFGTIPGLQKPELHYKYPNIEDFSKMLVELSATVAPSVTVVDAIDAMEGNGPNSGTKRHVGAVLVSKNMYAADYVAAKYIGLDTDQVQTVKISGQMGLFNADECELMGEPLPKLDRPFLLPDTRKLDFLDKLPRFMRKPASVVMKAVLKSVPRIDKEKCVGCGRCAESCPAHIIEIKNKKACIGDKSKCISCFCCHEMCPAHAVKIKRRLGKIN
ncbi:MAG: DUF362 domain-containing protein [Ruminococcaceae bacterium]|nr:DUF362 domain-containing protein [Oscillospiraceae bacterium]